MMMLNFRRVGLSGHENGSFCELTNSVLRIKRRRPKRETRLSVDNFMEGVRLYMTVMLLYNIGMVRCFSAVQLRIVAWTRNTSKKSLSHYVRGVPWLFSLSDDANVSEDDENEIVAENTLSPSKKFYDDDEEYIDDGKFEIATGMSINDYSGHIRYK